MKKVCLFVLGILFSVFLASTVSAVVTYDSNDTIITECGEIVEAGTYELENNITGSGSCIKIKSGDVILDGNNFEITGDGLMGLDGILIKDFSNITIKNIIIKNFVLGINLNNVDNSFFLDNSISLNLFGSISGFNSDNNQIIGNVLDGNLDFSIYFNGDSNNNLIQDTILDKIKLEGDSTATALNSIYDKDKTDIEEGSALTIEWYLEVVTVQDDVTITINNESGIVGKNEVEDGSYIITAEKKGYMGETREVIIFGDNNATSFNLTEIPGPEEEPEPAPVVSSSSGSGSTPCGDWSECIDGRQEKSCGTSIVGRDCMSVEVIDEDNTIVLEEADVSEEGGDVADGGFFSAITGAVIGGGAAGWSIAIVFVLLIGGSFAVVKIRKKRKLKK